MKHALAILSLMAFFVCHPTFAQSSPVVQPGFDGIFEAFRTHPLVGLGETHRRAQEIDFYTALIRDPRFARDVGNVVVEFGGAAHQDIIDRYVAGEDRLRPRSPITLWIAITSRKSRGTTFYRQVKSSIRPTGRTIQCHHDSPIIER